MTKAERILYSWKPISLVIHLSKKTVLPGFKGLPLFDVVQLFQKQIKHTSLSQRAASIAFNLIMALPAALLFLFSVIPYLPASLNFKGQIFILLKDLTPNSSTYKLIEGILNDLLKKHVGVFSFGFLLVIFYASNATMCIIRTFDYSIAENKNYFFYRRWRAIRLTFILIFLILGSSLVLVGEQQLSVFLNKIFHIKVSKMVWWRSCQWLIVLALFFFTIAFIYRYAPSVKKKWGLFSAGGVIATILMLCSTIAFSFWVNNFASYNKVYGSIGTVMIIMLLIYLNSSILLIGFELNICIAQGAKMLTKTKH